MVIWFDMDGTIADLYGVENWLDMLLQKNATPYENAMPLLNMQVLARRLNSLQRKGYEIGIISWLAKCGGDEYGEKVIAAKRKWLSVHLKSVRFDYVDIVPYGTPKQIGRSGILFDDELPNRNAWGNGAYGVENILEVLKGLAQCQPFRL